jgi:hypothetical protein
MATPVAAPSPEALWPQTVVVARSVDSAVPPEAPLLLRAVQPVAAAPDPAAATPAPRSGPAGVEAAAGPAAFPPATLLANSTEDNHPQASLAAMRSATTHAALRSAMPPHSPVAHSPAPGSVVAGLALRRPNLVPMPMPMPMSAHPGPAPSLGTGALASGAPEVEVVLPSSHSGMAGREPSLPLVARSRLMARADPRAPTPTLAGERPDAGLGNPHAATWHDAGAPMGAAPLGDLPAGWPDPGGAQLPMHDTPPAAPAVAVAAAAPSGFDVDDLVERAWRALMARLALEQERRGLGRWN